MTDDKALRWMPQDMPLGDRLDYLSAYPDDPHRAAAMAWEDHAAALQDTADGQGGVTSVSTGAQSVSYSDGYGTGSRGDALRRAAFHRARMKPLAVQVQPDDTEHYPRAEVTEMQPWADGQGD